MEPGFYDAYDYTQDFELDSLESRVQLPYVLKNKRLIGPGRHNGLNYRTDTLQKIYNNTQWNKHTRALFYDHVDTAKGGGARTWIGEIRNQRMKPDGSVYADIYVLDKQAAINLEYGAKFGISCKIQGRSDPVTQSIVNGVYANWSLVFDPADKQTYLNQDGWYTFLNFEEKTMDIEEQNEGDGTSETRLSDLQKSIESLSDEIRELKKGKPEDIADAVKWIEENAPEGMSSMIVDAIRSAKSEEEMKKKKYPKPRKEDEEEMEDESKAPSEDSEEKKPESEDAASKENKEETLEELSDEELDELFENKSYREFVKDYLKKNKGATIQDAAKAWKKEGKTNAESQELAELKKKVEALELDAKPSRKTVKHDGNTDLEDVVANLSDEELDRAFAEHVIQAAYKEDRWQ